MRPASPFSPRRVALTCFATLVLAPATLAGQLTRSAPAALTDAEFWHVFTTMSEPGGTFSSENFVSNETSFQHVIPPDRHDRRGIVAPGQPGRATDA